MDSDGSLLIGVDLEKEPELLHRAYNDAEGITADFNLNILNHANRLLDGNFDTGLFDHVAFYNERERRIEMHLQSSVAHEVQLLDHRIHTEYSYKYTLESFAKLVNQAVSKPSNTGSTTNSYSACSTLPDANPFDARNRRLRPKYRLLMSQ